MYGSLTYIGKYCTEQGKVTKTIIGKKHSFQMESVEEPYEEVQLEFFGPLPDENPLPYILVAMEK